MSENQGHPERRVTRCLGLMRKPTIESVLALYTAVTGEEPPTEVAVKVRATFERDESEAQSRLTTRRSGARALMTGMLANDVGVEHERATDFADRTGSQALRGEVDGRARDVALHCADEKDADAG